MLKFRTEKHEDVLVLSLMGQLDALTAGFMTRKIDELLNTNVENASAKQHFRRLVFNLSDLNLIDSRGVSVILTTMERARARGGDARVAGLKKQPFEIFRLLKLDTQLGITHNSELRPNFA